MLAGAEIVDKGPRAVAAYSQGNAENTVSVSLPTPMPPKTNPIPEETQTQGLTRVPTTDPVDIHFSNITCTVKLGINKGKQLLLHATVQIKIMMWIPLNDPKWKAYIPRNSRCVFAKYNS